MSVSNTKTILLKYFPGIKFGISLKDLTTFRIGGLAKYFLEAKTSKEILEVIKLAKKIKLSFFIIGGGSNVLFSDKGFNGLVIKISNQDLKIQRNSVKSGAGVKLSKLNTELVRNSLSGLEWSVGIPGTAGGAVWANAGTFGQYMSDSVKAVEVLDTKAFKIKRLNPKQCQFSYKESIFKKNPNLIILCADLVLEKGDARKMSSDIAEMQNKRKTGQPLDYPSAGCVFKNIIRPIKNKKLISLYPELAVFNQRKMIPAGYLIEKSGLKGKRIGQAQISEKHANFIINLGKAKAKDVLQLIKLAKKEVKKRFKIDMEEEIKIVN